MSVERGVGSVVAALLLGNLVAAPGCLLPEYTKLDGEAAQPAPGPTTSGSGCCSASGEEGCADAAIAECVCETDTFCCELGWDESCVDLVDAKGCGTCGSSNDPPDGGECTSDAACSSDLPFCESGYCVQCKSHADCTQGLPAFPYCGDYGLCGECQTGEECGQMYGADYPICLAGACVECTADADCGAGYACLEGYCG